MLPFFFIVLSTFQIETGAQQCSFTFPHPQPSSKEIQARNQKNKKIKNLFLYYSTEKCECLHNVEHQHLVYSVCQIHISISLIRATSHTSLKARDHCNLRALIGQKGGDCSSSLHTWRWRPKGPKKTLWMKSLHGFLHDGLWKRFHGLPEFSSGQSPRGGPHANSRRL